MPDKEKKRPKPEKAQLETNLSPAQPLDTIAIELRLAREAKGLSHSDLNRLTGISRSVLFGYEAGRTKPGAKEIRLLAEALKVNPNRLLFGTDEPFKPRSGLRALVKLKGSPLLIVVSTMLIPVIFATLDDEQIESILILLASLVEARDKDAYKKLSVFSEVMAEQIGDGTPEAMSALLVRSNDPQFMGELNKEIEERVKAMR